jgi:hypothetical protein
VRSDPDGAFDESKLIGFGCVGPGDKASDWIADRLVKGPTGLVAWGVDQFGSVSSPRWPCVIIP